MAGQLYWLASYPKSGNTWMRVLLTNYMIDADKPVDINQLSGGPIASARSIFDDNVGIEASDLTQDEIERLRPYVYQQMSDDLERERAADPSDSEPLFLKVHDAYTRTSEGRPLIAKEATAGVVYLLRDPLDVAPSFAHHADKPLRHAVHRMANSEASFVGTETRLHNQLRQRLLTWSEHVISWVDEPGIRLLPVRYEDLSTDPIGTLTEVLRFANVDPDPSRVAKAVDFSRFDRLQAQETDAGFGERTPGTQAFFRKGQVGSWRESLTDELAAKIRSDHAVVRKRFGYDA